MIGLKSEDSWVSPQNLYTPGFPFKSWSITHQYITMYTDVSPISSQSSSYSWGKKEPSKSEMLERSRRKCKSTRRRVIRACMRCRLRKTKVILPTSFQKLRLIFPVRRRKALYKMHRGRWCMRVYEMLATLQQGIFPRVSFSLVSFCSH